MGEKEKPEVSPSEAEVPEEKKKEAAEETAAPDLIDKANAAAARMEQANAERKNLLSKEEALKVKETLGGKADATSQSKGESAEDYAKKVMANEVDTDGK